MEKTIDELDRSILRIITKNARIPFKDVADECGVSRAAVHQRVQRLIELGVITGSSYNVNPKCLGYHKLQCQPEMLRLPNVCICRHYTRKGFHVQRCD